MLPLPGKPLPQLPTRLQSVPINLLLLAVQQLVLELSVRLRLPCLIVASLAHDLDHPGYTNKFLIESKHELAERYNESSVLENYHASIFIRIIQTQQFDIFEFLGKYKQVLKKQIVGLILATELDNSK